MLSSNFQYQREAHKSNPMDYYQKKLQKNKANLQTQPTTFIYIYMHTTTVHVHAHLHFTFINILRIFYSIIHVLKLHVDYYYHYYRA